jgi:hypothetical protein
VTRGRAPRTPQEKAVFLKQSTAVRRGLIRERVHSALTKVDRFLGAEVRFHGLIRFGMYQGLGELQGPSGR